MALKNSILLVIAFLFIHTSTVKSEGIKNTNPNIVLIFIDDAGYADFGFQGSQEFKTPNLDKLAKKGIQFTNGYVTSPGCGPSRAGLMTGRYQQTFGFVWNNVPGAMDEASKYMGADMGLPPEEVTIAEALKKYGYTSMAIGKWHLGLDDRFHPLQHGFDKFYGFRAGMRSYWPLKNPENKGYRRMESDFRNFEEPENYLTDAFGKVAAEFIKENSENPFFLYFAPNAVHTPLEAKDEDLQKFNNLTGNRRILAAMTFALDRAVGKIIQQLKESGIVDNTIIVFCNDNGGPTYSTLASNYPLSGVKGTLYEGGIRVPWIIYWKNHFEGGIKNDAVISTLDLFPTFLHAAGGNIDSYKQFDGVELESYLNVNNSLKQNRCLYWREAGVFGVRCGDKKLLDHPDQPAELFNLKEDVAEINNTHYQEVATVREMYKFLYKWRNTNARPLWMFKPEADSVEVMRGHLYRRGVMNE